MNTFIFTSYYIIAIILMLIMLRNYRKNLFAILIILLAFSGTIDYWIPRGTQLMNVVTVLMSSYLLIRNQVWKEFQYFRYLMISFVIFSLYFVFNSLLVHHDNVLFVFSQYSKYLVPFLCLLLFFYYARKGTIYMRYFNHLIGLLLLIQVWMSAYKFVFFGGQHWEGMVGTFGGVTGGGMGTSFPLIALCWVAINSNMDIRKWKSWLFIAGLLLLGIATGKRAVILLFPILFLILSIYVCKKKYSSRIWIIIAVAPVLFYLGVRLTPSFNPEKKVWGSFNLEYIMNYTKNYSTGRMEESTTQEYYAGRMGSVFAFWNVFVNLNNYSAKTLLGEGVERAYTSSEDIESYYQYGKELGLNHRGDVTGILMMYLGTGIVGVVLFVLYYCFLFRLVKYKRLRWVLLALVMFDFVFYNSTMNRNPFISMLVMYIIVYSLIQYSKHGKYQMVNYSLFDYK